MAPTSAAGLAGSVNGCVTYSVRSARFVAYCKLPNNGRKLPNNGRKTAAALDELICWISDQLAVLKIDPRSLCRSLLRGGSGGPVDGSGERSRVRDAGWCRRAQQPSWCRSAREDRPGPRGLCQGLTAAARAVPDRRRIAHGRATVVPVDLEILPRCGLNLTLHHCWG